MGIKMLLVWMATAFGGPLGHCAADEVAFANCAVKEKTLSVCGEAGSSPSWIQYRFGPLGTPELTYPAVKEGSRDKVIYEEGSAMHSSWDSFDFANDGYAFKVLFSEPFHGGSMAPEPFQGVIVSKDGKELAKLACTTPAELQLDALRGPS